MTINPTAAKHAWLTRFSQRLSSSTHRLVRNVKLREMPDELVIEGRTDSYHAVQLAISAINGLISSERLPLRVRLVLRVEGWPLEIVIANPLAARERATGRRRCERQLALETAQPLH